MLDIAWLCQQHSTLSDLRETKTLVDVEVVTNTGCVFAHRVVLAAHSRFFRARFSQDWGHEAKASVNLQHLQHDALLDVVRALYGGRLHLDEKNALDVLSIACELDVPALVEAATAYLQERVDADCACSVLLIASQYNLGELAKRASGCILSQIAAMTCSAGLVDDVYRLPLYAFDCLLHSAGEVMSPTDVFVLLLGWLVASFETRAPHLAQLLDCVTCDGELLRLAMLAHPCAMDATVAAAHFPQLQALAGKAPFSTSIGSGAETGGFSSSLQSCSSLMAFDMNDPVMRTSNLTEAFCDGSASDSAPCVPSAVPQSGHEAVAELTNWPHSALTPRNGGHARAMLFSALNMLLRGADAPLRGPGSPCCSVAAQSVATAQHLQGTPGIACNRHRRHDLELQQGSSTRRWQGSQLVAIGGRDAAWRGTACAAAYDTVADVWHRLPDLPHVLPCARAVGVQGSLYAWGSYVPPVCLDIGKSWDSVRWHESIAHEKLKRLIGYEVLASRQFAWVLGGRSLPNDVFANSWRCDINAGSWQRGPQLQQARYAASGCVMRSQPVITGGQDKVRPLHSVEVLDSERGWVEQAPMLHARKYHAAACVHRRIFCLGGKGSDNLRLSSIEACDPREGCWRVVADMPEVCSSFGCTKHGGGIYAVAGNVGSGRLTASTRHFCPLTLRWRDCADLPWACNSLGVCTVGL